VKEIGSFGEFLQGFWSWMSVLQVDEKEAVDWASDRWASEIAWENAMREVQQAGKK